MILVLAIFNGFMQSPCGHKPSLWSIHQSWFNWKRLSSSIHNILGDFKEDIFHQQNTAILKVMSTFSFKQLVQYPTTAQGTLIDHVYYRNTSGSTIFSIVQVQDTYYSDHDTELQHSIESIIISAFCSFSAKFLSKAA